MPRLEEGHSSLDCSIPWYTQDPALEVGLVVESPGLPCCVAASMSKHESWNWGKASIGIHDSQDLGQVGLS